MLAPPARSRLVVVAAVAVLAVLAVVALLVVRDGGGGDGELATGGLQPPTTASTTVTTPPAAAVATTLPASTTSAAPKPVTTAAGLPPRTAATTTAASSGETLTTTAGSHGPVEVALAQARHRWAASRPAGGYVWSYVRACRCSPRKLEVTVARAGSVTSVRELDGAPAAQPVALGLSVDGALAEVQAAIDADAAQISVRFDPVRGLPSFYSIDRSTRLADEERGLSLLTFTPRS